MAALQHASSPRLSASFVNGSRPAPSRWTRRGHKQQQLATDLVLQTSGLEQSSRSCAEGLLCRSTPMPNVSTQQLPPLWALDSSFPDSHSFSSYANWLVPGSVMLGRYPYVEPSRLTDVEQGEAQLEKILRAGITTFVSLQRKPIPGAEDPERLAAFTHPSYELFFLHHPVEDLGVPDSKEGLNALLDDLVVRMGQGEKLYIHCWGGRGRAGLVGACLLREAYGISAEEALIRVQKAFDTRIDNKLRSPETDEQHMFVKAYVPRRW
ncbi:protein-tyrosine phosphatase-like protein [Dunaliella salina]|uniref:Protein-tyrosine phosphatase-like protein n=1 Tax=Dunaliella salina TaxID=3046 RepID=A0ABQ7GE32_DUNSA|nr:protein-tyrosine phosphatase-like protein [Dunaliella salina]|eukprot:KAF5832794.1 protein-tyrosine phosphatase-like protein [Dunaliella salina]